MIAFVISAALQASAPPPPLFDRERDEFLIYFASGSATLDALAAPVIEDAARQIALYKPRRIVAWAHTDTLGEADANLQLSMRRAKAVSEALVRAGAPAERIELQPSGESELAVATGDDVPEPLNNRVVVILKDTIPPRR